MIKIDTSVNNGVKIDKSFTKYGKKFVNIPSRRMDITIIITGIILLPLTLLHSEYH